MKIIFLDVDGVLSSMGVRGLCSQRLDLFADIVKQTGAEVVLSSTWRLPMCREQRFRLMQELGKRDVELSGMTPVLNEPVGSGLLVKGVQRGDEIQTYLNAYRRQPIRFVILDDDPNDEMGRLKPHLVKCDGFTGLTPELAQEAINRLKD